MKMKLFSSAGHMKRGIFLFIVGFILPIFFVFGISVDTFLKRLKTNRNLLESNLWISGRSAAMQFELDFINKEEECFNRIVFPAIAEGNTQPVDSTCPAIFLLDNNYKLIYPETVYESDLTFFQDQSDWGAEFRQWMELAESEEMLLSNHRIGARYYLNALELASTPGQESLAIEGLARSNFNANQLHESIKHYWVLATTYSHLNNRSGHPFGLSAPLQLYAAGLKTGKEVITRDSLINIYRKIKDGFWILSSSSFNFFCLEYESILGEDVIKYPSRYGHVLPLTDFLKTDVIPRLEENIRISGKADRNAPRRLLIDEKDNSFIISFKEIFFAESGGKYIAGILWNLDSIRTGVIPSFVEKLSEETALELVLLNEATQDILTNEVVSIPEHSLLLPFNEIPLPWTLLAIQPGFQYLELDIKRQVIVYGILLILILSLMLFGIIMLLRDMNREAESMLQKTEFVNNVSHELRTPLSLIRLYGETLMIRHDLSLEERMDALQIITKESERLSHMINNILDFSKMEIGKKEFNIKEDNLSQVVSDTVDSYQYHLERKGFTVQREIIPGIPLLMFDRHAVEAIVINLLSNAIKYSSDNKWVSIKLDQTAKEVILTVSDQGAGIPANDLPHVFDRFYRSKTSGGSEAGGSGLGLTLVRHAVESHGWKIDVASQPGQGTTFTIRIPLNNKKEG